MAATILMPAYNAEKYITEAVESVLAQSQTDFEFILIDDGSTDSTGEIGRRYANADQRIRLISRPNEGLAHSLNEGLALASNAWVAIMHADDVMAPNRIERQLAFIEANPSISLASSFVRYIDSRGRRIGQYRSPFTDASVVDACFQGNRLVGFHHPATILKRSAVQDVGGYRQAYWPCEDVDLWNRVLERGYKLLVQPEFLLAYRIHGASASVSRARFLLLKEHWVKESMRARRKGRPEPDWDAFLRSRRTVSPIERADRFRREAGAALYKAAVAAYANGGWSAAAWRLAVAGLLRPVHVYRKIAMRLPRFEQPGGEDPLRR